MLHALLALLIVPAHALTEAQLAALTVLEVEHDPLAGGVAGPATAALPELGGLQLRQQGFQRAGGVELPIGRAHV